MSVRDARRVAGAAVIAAAALMVSAVDPGSAPARPVGAHAAVFRGVQVPLADAPWIATITSIDTHGRPARTPPGHALSCTAAVIGPRLVLTATHCIVGIDPTSQGIRVATDNLLSNPGRVIPVARVWSPRVGARGQVQAQATDMAVIETTKPLGVPALAIATARPQAGEAVSAFGFGVDDDVPDPAKGAARPFLRRWDAIALSSCPVPIDRDELCVTAAARDGGGTRPGDSGGPLVVFRNGAPELVGDTVQEVNVGVENASGFADVVAQRGLIASLPKSKQVSVATRPIRIAGRARPGGKVTCQVAFSPKPIAIDYSWYVGGKPRPIVNGAATGPFYYNKHGLRTPYLKDETFVSQRRSFTIPRNATGKRLQCTATAYQGAAYATDAVAVIPRLPRR
jgi:hypothetical protein